MAENPVPKGVYTAQEPISPATTPTSTQVDSLPFSEATTRPTLPATSFYSHSDSSQQDTQSTKQPLRQTLSPSPSPLTRPYTPQHIAYSTSSSSNPSPSDSMMLSGTKPPTIDKLQEMLEDFFSSDSNSSDSGMFSYYVQYASSLLYTGNTFIFVVMYSTFCILPMS